MTAPETAGWAGPRRLLRRMRDIMASRASGQARLDQIVRLIAAEMVAEVCSVYVRRAGEVLELFATEGLKPEAVHRTRLRVGEGLVGHIAARARPLALADAQHHPLFAYRPETGEEVYASLMGVPVLRGGRVQGVLVVQNRSQRHYAEEELETLETIAMVLAELFAGGDLIGLDEAVGDVESVFAPRRIEGAALSAGLAAGIAAIHRHVTHVERMVADDPREESRRLAQAIDGVWGALDDLLERPELAGDGEHREIMETYRMFAHDRGWLQRIEEAIRTGLTAEAAVQKVQNDARARMAQATDAYLRERLMDLEDLANRLMLQLAGSAAAAPLPQEAVLFARSMGPAELLSYDRARLQALVVEEGSATAHVAIVARALGLPLVRAAGAIAVVEPGDPVLVDGEHGQVFIRPTDRVRGNFDAVLAARAARQAGYAALRDLPAESADGVAVTLLLNAGLLLDLARLAECGAAGVGLFRTEIPFMLQGGVPDVAAQAELYRRALDEAGGRPLVFRTLDVGGDKVMPHLAAAVEDNPAMGWRALRIGLDRPAVLRQQLRALLRAGAGRELDLMFPLVAELAEVERARALLERERARLAPAAGPRRVRVGVMLEVPALLYQLDRLLPLVDFVSVGTNDLAQFLYASDRGNPRLEGRYDTLSPPLLSLLAEVARACAAAGVPVTVCGEMAGQPLEALALLAIGYRSLSMAPASIGPVKEMIRSLPLAAATEYLAELRTLSAPSVRERLRSFARDHLVRL